MGTRGYDDTQKIAEIKALMEARPGMSRKAAIRQVVGDGNVRRIEMKMSRQADEPTPTSEDAELCIQTGSNPTEMMLVTAERQALAGSGEKVRWSAFNDTQILEERLRVELLGPDYKARVDRMEGYLFKAMGFVALFFVCMVGMLPIALLGRLIGVPTVEIREAVSPVAAICLAGLIPSVLTTISLTLRVERITRPFDQMVAANPIAPRETRRYVLTDKAMYVFRPDGNSVRIQRVDVGSITAVERDKDGDLVFRSRQSEMPLKAATGVDKLLAFLGGNSRSGHSLA
jgi:hypothetical protein